MISEKWACFLIVPVDEDDWFRADLVKNLREIKEPIKSKSFPFKVFTILRDI